MDARLFQIIDWSFYLGALVDLIGYINLIKLEPSRRKVGERTTMGWGETLKEQGSALLEQVKDTVVENLPGREFVNNAIDWLGGADEPAAEVPDKEAKAAQSAPKSPDAPSQRKGIIGAVQDYILPPAKAAQYNTSPITAPGSITPTTNQSETDYKAQALNEFRGIQPNLTLEQQEKYVINTLAIEKIKVAKAREDFYATLVELERINPTYAAQIRKAASNRLLKLDELQDELNTKTEELVNKAQSFMASPDKYKLAVEAVQELSNQITKGLAEVFEGGLVALELGTDKANVAEQDIRRYREEIVTYIGGGTVSNDVMGYINKIVGPIAQVAGETAGRIAWGYLSPNSLNAFEALYFARIEAAANYKASAAFQKNRGKILAGEDVGTFVQRVQDPTIEDIYALADTVQAQRDKNLEKFSTADNKLLHSFDHQVAALANQCTDLSRKASGNHGWESFAANLVSPFNDTFTARAGATLVGGFAVARVVKAAPALTIAATASTALFTGIAKIVAKTGVSVPGVVIEAGMNSYGQANGASKGRDSICVEAADLSRRQGTPKGMDPAVVNKAQPVLAATQPRTDSRRWIQSGNPALLNGLNDNASYMSVGLGSLALIGGAMTLTPELAIGGATLILQPHNVMINKINGRQRAVVNAAEAVGDKRAEAKRVQQRLDKLDQQIANQKARPPESRYVVEEPAPKAPLELNINWGDAHSPNPPPPSQGALISPY